MVKDKLIVFLMKVRGVQTGLGFEAFGWSAVLVSNPTDTPSTWKMKYLNGPETYGLIAGSAAVLKDEKFLYANSFDFGELIENLNLYFPKFILIKIIVKKK